MDFSNLKPHKQKKIFAHEENLSELINLYDQKNLPNRILLSGIKGIGKATLAYHLVNYIFSIGEKFQYNKKDLIIDSSNRSYNLLINNTHPNFHLIDLVEEKKVIEISQIRKMINYTNKSSFNSKEKIVLLDNIENLNTNSINALLKIIEEPNDKLYFILILDNRKSLLNTLKSRCLKFNLYMDNLKSLDVANKILDVNLKDLINHEFISHYNTPADYIDLIKFSNDFNIDLKSINVKNFLKIIINEKHYKKNLFCKKLIYKYIEQYFLFIILQNKYNFKIYSLYEEFIKKINNIRKYNLDEESFFVEFQLKILNG